MGELNLLLIGLVIGLIAALTIMGRPQVIIHQERPEATATASGGCITVFTVLVGIIGLVAAIGLLGS